MTVRRLNRVEYRNTIHDLMGIDFNADAEFPPDDTGYGFDDIGDVLTVSPMLLEKYLAAANEIVTEAVPTISRTVQERTVLGRLFTDGAADDGSAGKRLNQKDSSRLMSYYDRSALSNTYTADVAGTYAVTLGVAVKGNFDFDPGRCRVVFKINGARIVEKGIRLV